MRVRLRARWLTVVWVPVLAAVAWLATSAEGRSAGFVDHGALPENGWWWAMTGSRMVYLQSLGDRVSIGRVPVSWTDEAVVPPARRSAAQWGVVNRNGGAFVRASGRTPGHPRRASPVDI